MLQGAEFAGGTGTQNDPYQIATAEQLLFIRSGSSLCDKHFVLVCDIDMENRSVGPTLIDTFSGVFDGRGFRIANVLLGRGDASCTVGLFRNIQLGGVVKNLIVEGVYISSTYGATSGAGICGANLGVISKCSVTCQICEVATAGGVAAWNYGVIEECRSVCTILGSGTYGGLVGVNKGRISNCWSSGLVWGWHVAGLTVSHEDGEIGNCYSTCQVQGIWPESSAGGLIDALESPGSGILSCYFLDLNSGGGPDNGLGEALSDSQMKQQASFAGWDFWGTDGDGVQDVWFMPSDGYPDLAWYGSKPIPSVAGLLLEDAYATLEQAGFRIEKIVCDYDHAIECGQVITTWPYPVARPDMGLDVVLSLGTYDWSLNEGTGDAENPYLISSSGRLDCLAYRPDLWDKSFGLVSDLDMGGRVYTQAVLGRCELAGEVFNGAFDGNGHVIKNVTIEGASATCVPARLLGFFGKTGSQAQITDLGLADISLLGAGSASGIGGMLCAINGGSFGRCYSRGTIRSFGEIGGFVGRNTGAIQDCYAQGRVENISCDDANSVCLCAGFVAHNVGGAVTTSYSTCSVTPDGGAGLVASNEGGSVDLCLWDTEVSGVSGSAAGTGLTTEELMNGWTLDNNGWGGNPNWILDSGRDYPRLIWEGAPGTLIPRRVSRGGT